MTLSEDDLERIVSAVETMEASLSVLVEKQSLSRSAYRTDRSGLSVDLEARPTGFAVGHRHRPPVAVSDALNDSETEASTVFPGAEPGKPTPATCVTTSAR
jgi:hypothetical protein